MVEGFEWKCAECEFSLYGGVARLQVSDLALVSDARYPGRCILGLREHQEHCDTMSASTFIRFCRDAQVAAAAIRATTGCDRMNMFLLGNRTSHLHFHLVPRLLGSNDPPTPFEDPAPIDPLSPDDYERIGARVAEAIGNSRSGRSG